MTHVFLLLVDVPNLEPDVGMGEGTRGIAKYAVKAGKGLLVFALLFVDNAEAEKNFVGLIKVLIMVISKTRQKTRRG